LSDSKGQTVPGISHSEGDPFVLDTTRDGSLPAGVYTLSAPQSVGFQASTGSGDFTVNYDTKLSLSPRAIPLPTALLSGGPTLLGLALFVRLRRRHIRSLP